MSVCTTGVICFTFVLWRFSYFLILGMSLFGLFSFWAPTSFPEVIHPRYSLDHQCNMFAAFKTLILRFPSIIKCLKIGKKTSPNPFTDKSFILILIIAFSLSVDKLQSQTKYLEQSKEIKQNWTELKNFDMCFCILFCCYCQKFI